MFVGAGGHLDAVDAGRAGIGGALRIAVGEVREGELAQRFLHRVGALLFLDGELDAADLDGMRARHVIGTAQRVEEGGAGEASLGHRGEERLGAFGRLGALRPGVRRHETQGRGDQHDAEGRDLGHGVSWHVPMMGSLIHNDTSTSSRCRGRTSCMPASEPWLWFHA